MRVTQNTYARHYLQQSTTTRSEISRLQQQISSGERLQKPSDDPLGSGKSVHLEKTLSELKQYERNGNYAESRLAMEEAALRGISEKLVTLRELAIRTNNDTLHAQDHKIYLQDIISAQEEITGYINSKGPNGEYLFSGSDREKKPLSDTGDYQGNFSTQAIKIGMNSTLAIGTAAANILEYETSAGTSGIFSTIESMHNLIESASNQAKPADFHTSMASMIKGFEDAHSKVESLEANVGHRLALLDSVRENNEEVKLMLSGDLNSVKSVDYADAISKLENEILSLEAMQSTYAKLNKLSLFNYVS